MGENYGRRFEWRLKKARLQAMALFPGEQNPLHDPLGRFESPNQPAPDCIQSINKAYAERFIDFVRQECLDWFVIISE